MPIMVGFSNEHLLRIWIFLYDYLDRYGLLDDNRVLVIHAVQLNDNARYTCIGTNIAGELSNHIDLQIFGMMNRMSFCFFECWMIKLSSSDNTA